MPNCCYVLLSLCVASSGILLQAFCPSGCRESLAGLDTLTSALL